MAECVACEFNDCAGCDAVALTRHEGCCCGCIAAVDCVYGDGHDGPCLDPQDVEEERLRARDYEAWANL